MIRLVVLYVLLSIQVCFAQEKDKCQTFNDSIKIVGVQKARIDSMSVFSYYPKLKPVKINHYKSGHLQRELFIWTNSNSRYNALQFTEQVKYVDTGVVCPSVRHSNSFDTKVFTYENCQLVSKKVSPKSGTLNQELDRSLSQFDYNYRIEKGTFVHERLQTGVIEFYNDSSELLRTEIVKDSYQNTKELVFRDTLLFQRLLRHYPLIDLDQNGAIDTYEADQVRYLGFNSNGTKNLDELNYFKNLINYFDYDHCENPIQLIEIDDMSIPPPVILIEPKVYNERFVIEE